MLSFLQISFARASASLVQKHDDISVIDKGKNIKTVYFQLGAGW